MLTQHKKQPETLSLLSLHEIIQGMNPCEKLNVMAFLATMLNLDINPEEQGSIPTPLNPKCLTFQLLAMKLYPDPGEPRQLGYKELIAHLVY